MAVWFLFILFFIFLYVFVLVSHLVPIFLWFLVAILANQIVYICAYLLLRQVIYYVHIVVATEMHLGGLKGAVEFHHLLIICDSHESTPDSHAAHNIITLSFSECASFQTHSFHSYHHGEIQIDPLQSSKLKLDSCHGVFDITANMLGSL